MRTFPRIASRVVARRGNAFGQLSDSFIAHILAYSTIRMFSRIDKKVLIISLTCLAVASLAGFVIYKYISSPVAQVQNLVGGAQAEANIQ